MLSPKALKRNCLLAGMAVGLAALSGCGFAPPKKPVRSALEAGRIDLPRLALERLPEDEFAPWRPQAWQLSVWRLDEELVGRQAKARAWLGWSDSALHLTLSIREPTRLTAPQDEAIFRGDSVEVVVNSRPEFRGSWQVAVAPGSATTAPRAEVFDYRRGEKESDAFEYRVRETIDGYSIELEIPWETAPGSLGQPGDEFYLLININNAYRDGFERLRLPLINEHRRERNWVQARLTGRGGPPIPMAAWIEVRNFTELTLVAEVEPAYASQTFTARNGARELGTMAFSSNTSPPRLLLPLPQLSHQEEWQPIRITTANGTLAGLALTPNLKRVRDEILFRDMPTWGAYLHPGVARGQNEWARLEMDRHVVMMDLFPDLSFNDPERVTELLGQEPEIETEFYDSNGAEVDRPYYPGAYGAVSRVDVGDGVEREVRHLIYRIADNDPIPDHSDEETAFRLLAEDELGRPPEPSDLAPEEYALFWWHDVDKLRGVAEPLPYFVLEPETAAEEPLPVLVFLHGSGARNLEQLRNDGTIRAIAESGFPGLVVVPLSKGRWHPAQLLEVLAEVEGKYPVDRGRIYLTGFSKGGSGVWDIALAIPSRFAAILPVAGADTPEPERVEARLDELPAFVVWGELDDAEAAARASLAVEIQQAAGLDSRFLLLPGANHLQTYRRIYRMPEIYEWLLEHRKAPAPGAEALP